MSTAGSCAQLPDEDALRALIRKGTIQNAFVPVLCGSAFKNKGVQPLLDAVNAYLPSPLDVPPMKACAHCTVLSFMHVRLASSIEGLQREGVRYILLTPVRARLPLCLVVHDLTAV